MKIIRFCKPEKANKEKREKLKRVLKLRREMQESYSKIEAHIGTRIKMRDNFFDKAKKM